jgi:hypothetical protein
MSQMKDKTVLFSDFIESRETFSMNPNDEPSEKYIQIDVLFNILISKIKNSMISSTCAVMRAACSTVDFQLSVSR